MEKDFSKLTSDELLKLPKDVFVKYMLHIEEEKYNSMTDFGVPDYINFSHEAKVNFWCEQLNRSMRIQAESGLDEYIMFKPIWYKTMKRLEPNFDLIIDAVFEKFKLYQWDWKKEEYLKRIKG